MSTVTAYNLLLVGIGGGLGSILRYLVTLATANTAADFPFGTLLVNVLGSAVLGFLAGAWTGPVLVSEGVRLAVLVGLLGGFTTFSTYAFESVRLAGDGQWLWLGLNVTLNNALALLAAWAGYRLAEWLYGVA